MRAVVALALCACAVSPVDLAPYPCPRDGVCAEPENNDGTIKPDWLACVSSSCQHFIQCTPAVGNEAPTCDPKGPAPRCTPAQVGKSRLSTICVPAPPGKIAGASCTMTVPPASSGAIRFPTRVPDECNDGLFCASPFFDPDVPASCRPLCTADTDCKTAGERCFQIFAAFGAGSGGNLIGLCFPSCSVFATPDPCPAGLSCIAMDFRGSATGVCARPGTRKDGEICSPFSQNQNDNRPVLCEAGLQCIPEGGAGALRCRAVCPPSGPSNCPAGTTCQNTTNTCSGQVCSCR